MKKYLSLSVSERTAIYNELKNEYESYLESGLSLDLSRGKPNGVQLDTSLGLMSVDLSGDYLSEDGFDCRNYGVLDGLPEMKRFFADAYGIRAEDIIVGGNSSLQLMYNVLTTAMLHGVATSNAPWCREQGLKWICITPGYDRHFRITEQLGFELLDAPMKNGQPDMDLIEELALDPKVKGVWCIPKYSNPSGITYNEDTVRRLVSMKCGAPDFLVMWDNAYGIHDFTEDADSLPDIFKLAEEYGTLDRVFYFSSTSKVTFPGGGVAFMAANPTQRSHFLRYLGAQTIGFDKLNQLRHLRFFGNAENLHKHMLALGARVKRKFDIALAELSCIEGLGIASWTVPKGGYFITLNVLPGTAKRVYELMCGAGVTLTPVGATHPYGVDPTDSTIRLAPTYPTDDELELAMKILAIAVRLAAIENLNA